MTQPIMPSSGGSYIRHPDGSLTLDEAPTAEGLIQPADFRAVEVPAEPDLPIETPADPPADVSVETRGKASKSKTTEA